MAAHRRRGPKGEHGRRGPCSRRRAASSARSVDSTSRRAMARSKMDLLIATTALAEIGWAHQRICRDGLGYLVSQQTADGAIGYPAVDSPGERLLALRVWTAAAVRCLSAYLVAAR
jgi:hypothetical protein